MIPAPFDELPLVCETAVPTGAPSLSAPGRHRFADALRRGTTDDEIS
jgi:hypothetical protein